MYFFKRIFLLIIILGSGNICYGDTSGLQQLEHNLYKDLDSINYFHKSWREDDVLKDPIYDVVIIGSGMAGMTVAFGLMRAGVNHIKIYDENLPYSEGAWNSCARMKTLRSDKDLMGPALFMPNLTFQSWFKAKYNQQAWDSMHKIPTHLWVDYLNWYRKVLRLPIENEMKAIAIVPEGNYLCISLQKGKEIKRVCARKVVLATGRSGFGGADIPFKVKELSRHLYAHSCDKIDFCSLREKNIAIIGYGASAWDAALAALDEGVASVTMLMRRSELAKDIEFFDDHFPGFHLSFSTLPDGAKWQFMQFTLKNGMPPPPETVDQVRKYGNFQLCANTRVVALRQNRETLEIVTDKGSLDFDFLIFATGFAIDGKAQQELAPLMSDILLWGDKLGCGQREKYDKAERFPYLGPHFEFMEKKPGKAPYLKNIYCFNYAAFLSHGLLSTDILGISLGAQKLSDAIVADLFTDNWEMYFNKLISK